MEQLALVAPLRALARRSDPATSRAAAASIDAESISGKVLAELREKGPGTSHELASRARLDLVTVSPRMKPLEKLGLVRRAGKRDNRTVWEATT